MDIINKYFPNLNEVQARQFAQLDGLYREWNDKINVISRKDIDNLYLHHILHSLAIYKWMPFKKDSRILDLGTGGGFPGIPLAIMHPDVHFHLVDSIRKKLHVVEEIAQAIGLENISVQHARVEDLRIRKFDFVVTRAVAASDQLFRWSKKHISPDSINTMPNGIIALKGGDVKKELKLLPRGEYSEVCKISDFFSEPYFEEKYIVYIQG